LRLFVNAKLSNKIAQRSREKSRDRIMVMQTVYAPFLSSISPFYYLPLLKNACSCLQNGILNIIVEKYAEICFHFPAFYYGGGFSTLSSM